MFPETYGRTLEELAFLFEDKSFAEEATLNVEKQIHTELDEWRTSYVPPQGVTTHISAAGPQPQDPFHDYSRWP